MSNSEGLLGLYNLWDFWNSLSEKHQNKIIDDLSKGAAFWDYKELFYGQHNYPDVRKGAIHILNTLLTRKNFDLEFCDILFMQFSKYIPEKYNDQSLGGKWYEEIKRCREVHQDLRKNASGEELKRIDELWKIYYTITPADVYWADTYFFLFNYAEKVYQNCKKSKCGPDRLYRAYLIEYENSEIIIESVNKLLGKFERDSWVGYRYLRYLERSGKYDECISIAKGLKLKGWRNDFTDNLIENCIAKIEGNGDKS